MGNISVAFALIVVALATLSTAASTPYAYQKIKFASYGDGYFFNSSAVLPAHGAGGVGSPLSSTELPRQRVDVTALLKGILETMTYTDTIYLYVSHDTFGISDPAPGVLKTLQIVFEYNYHLAHIVGVEGNFITLKNGPQTANPNYDTSTRNEANPLKVWWGLPNNTGYGGTVDQWVDKSVVTLDYALFVASQPLDAGTFGDPAVGVYKVLSMYWDKRFEYEGGAVLLESINDDVYFPPPAYNYG